MLLDLTQFRQPETELTRRYEPSAFEGRTTDFRVVSPVDLRLKVHKDKDRFRLVGTVSTVMELQCSRCLEPFQLPVDSIFDCATSAPENTGDEREVEEDDPLKRSIVTTH